MGVSMGLRAISTARSEYKGHPGDKIKQSQQNILDKLDKKIAEKGKHNEKVQLERDLRPLLIEISKLGDPKSIQTKGRRAMGYPKEALSKVIKALPEGQKNDVCTLLNSKLSLHKDFLTIGIDLDHEHLKAEQYGNRDDFNTVWHYTKFELTTTEYSKIEQENNIENSRKTISSGLKKRIDRFDRVYKSENDDFAKVLEIVTNLKKTIDELGDSQQQRELGAPYSKEALEKIINVVNAKPNQKEIVCELLRSTFKHIDSYDLGDAFETLGINVEYGHDVTETKPDTGGDGRRDTSRTITRGVTCKFELIPR
ncbi:MAG: hypothetical protein ISQ13_03740 [Candidatus Margulisbacteria bacterium]|nr:hypothetical protein [Candidatus Margulisiibacteriota bacterium]